MTSSLRRRAPLLLALVVLVSLLSAHPKTTSEKLAAAPADSTTLSTMANPNLLADPAFTPPALTPWVAAPGQNWAPYSASGAPAGGNYLETNPGSAAQTFLYQNATTAPLAGHSYQGSIYLRSPSGASVGVALVIWGLGSSNQVNQDDFTVSSQTWTRYYVDLDTASNVLNTLRFQVYFVSGGANLDLAGALLQDSGVGDAGFQQGMGQWIFPTGQNWAVYNSPAAGAPVGGDYLETNGGSVSDPNFYQDIPTIPVVGHSYQGSVFLRSPSAQPVSALVVVWGLGGAANEVGQTSVTVSSSTWEPYYVALDVADPGHTDLRFQVYLQSSGPNLDVDGAMVEDAGISDAAFDQSSPGPWVSSSCSNSKVEDPSGSSGSGSGSSSSVGDQDWFETSTSSAGSCSSGSWFYEDVPTNVVSGRSYSASIFLRSVTSGPISVAVVLWALNPATGQSDVGQTVATVGSSWQQYAVVLNANAAGYTDLRLQVYVSTSGQTLGADLPALADDVADPPLGPPALVKGVGLYGPSSSQSLDEAVAQGWPIVSETGGGGTQQSPWTTGLADAPDVAAAQAVAGHRVTWMTFWTVSAPTPGTSWYSAGYASGQYVATYLDSVSTSVKPAFVILDPEGYADGQPNYYPTDFTDWASWIGGWEAGIGSVDSTLTPALYVWQYLYSAYGLANLQLPVFMSISPIICSSGCGSYSGPNYPGLQDPSYVQGANVVGYQGYYSTCPAAQDEQIVESWGGSAAPYDVLLFSDGGSDCTP